MPLFLPTLPSTYSTFSLQMFSFLYLSLSFFVSFLFLYSLSLLLPLFIFHAFFSFSFAFKYIKFKIIFLHECIICKTCWEKKKGIMLKKQGAKIFILTKLTAWPCMPFLKRYDEQSSVCFFTATAVKKK